MIIVDRALEKRETEGTPIRVGIIGAGYMGRGIALHLPVTGMRLAAVYNRNVAQAKAAVIQSGAEQPVLVSSSEIFRRIL